jgi:hypothetical protein
VLANVAFLGGLRAQWRSLRATACSSTCWPGSR